MINVTCNKCGWVHFAVTRQHAIDEMTRFNEYYDSLTPEQQQDYYGGKKSTLTHYEYCFFCGETYKNFRPSQDGDCPMGCTIQGIIQD